MAFSGGPDSVALTLLLLEAGYKPFLAYVNHNLRGAASEKEEAFVRTFARRWDLPLEVYCLDPKAWPKGRGLQATARQLRYAWMEEILERHSLPWGLTAHTLDDQVETLLYRLFRGKEPFLWRGIAFRRGRWLRPLLEESRIKLVRYLEERGQSYVLDVSNYQLKYLRNRVRWQVIRPLLAINPNLASHIMQLCHLHTLQRRRLVRLYERLVARLVERRPFGFLVKVGLGWDVFFWLGRRWGHHWALLQSLYQLYRHGSVGAYRKVATVVYVKTPEGLEVGDWSFWAVQWPPLEVAGPGVWRWGLWELRLQVEFPSESSFFWVAQAWLPLCIRLWRPGDRMQPSGLHGASKRLSDIWPELGWYGFRRRHAFVVEHQGKIIYAAGYRPAEGYTHPSSPFLYFIYEYVQSRQSGQGL